MGSKLKRLGKGYLFNVLVGTILIALILIVSVAWAGIYWLFSNHLWWLGLFVLVFIFAPFLTKICMHIDGDDKDD